jgi:predicted ABC-type ATPase
MSKTLWIVAGPNGAGKSSLVARYNKEGLPVSNPDDIAKELRPSAPEMAAIQAAKSAIAQRRELFRQGTSFIIETTFSGANALGLIQQAHDNGYKVRMAFVAVAAPSISVLRVQSRVQMGGHYVPNKDVLRRYERSFANLQKSLPLIDHAYVINNSGRRPSIVARLQKGKVQRLHPRPPKWLQNRLPILARAMNLGLGL